MTKYILSIYFFLSLGLLVFAQDLNTKDAENQIIDAVALYDDRQFSEAADLLRKTVGRYPDNDAAHFYLGLSEFCLGNVDVAEDELKKAVEIDPGNYWYRYRLAMIYSATGREELTLAMLEDLISDFPKKYDLYYTMVELYQRQGQQEKALETLGLIETVFGVSDMTAIAHFDLLRNMGREEEAYEYLEEFNSKYSSVQVLSLLGDHQLSMYNDSSAIALYSEALDIDPAYAPAMLGKAEAYRITRKYDEYFDLLYAFVGNDVVSVEGKCSYLNALVRSSDRMFMRSFRTQMDSLMTLCTEKYPTDSSALFTAGVYYYTIGDKARAKNSFRTNLENWPNSVSVAASYVEMLAYMSEWQELVDESEKAAGRFPSEPAFWEYASLGQYNLGHYDQVIRICEKVLSLAPTDSSVVLSSYSTMGDMYYKLGDNKQAFKAYDKALKVNPDYLPVLNNYAYFLSLERKKLKKAYQMSRKTVEADPDNSTYLDTYGWILYLQGKYAEAKPIFKNAVMLYGGKESAVILDHYAEVLFALEEYDLAFVYWTQAQAKNHEDIPDLESRISERKSQMNKSRK